MLAATDGLTWATASGLLVAFAGLLSAVAAVAKQVQERRDAQATAGAAQSSTERSLAMQELELALRQQRAEMTRLRTQLEDSEADRLRLRQLYVQAMRDRDD